MCVCVCVCTYIHKHTHTGLCGSALAADGTDSAQEYREVRQSVDEAMRGIADFTVNTTVNTAANTGDMTVAARQLDDPSENKEVAAVGRLKGEVQQLLLAASHARLESELKEVCECAYICIYICMCTY